MSNWLRRLCTTTGAQTNPFKYIHITTRFSHCVQAQARELHVFNNYFSCRPGFTHFAQPPSRELHLFEMTVHTAHIRARAWYFRRSFPAHRCRSCVWATTDYEHYIGCQQAKYPCQHCIKYHHYQFSGCYRLANISGWSDGQSVIFDKNGLPHEQLP